jgi:hypothetical protein
MIAAESSPESTALVRPLICYAAATGLKYARKVMAGTLA